MGEPPSTTASASGPTAGGSAPTGPAGAGAASRGVWYTVRRGDTLSHIAGRHGLASWRTIYDAPENEEFRRTHPDPNLIYPGDRVFVPHPREKTETVPTTTRTRFRVRGTGVRLRFIFDNGDDNPNNDRELTYLCVSNLVSTDNLPEGFGPNPDGSADPDHFKIEIEDPHERADSIPADKVTLEALKPDGAGNYVSFNPPRRLQVECQRVRDAAGRPTNRFRSRYLRLVTDTLDQGANSDQCLLADWDPAQPELEILDQVVRVEYRRDDGERPQARIPIGHDRRKIRMAVHVLRTAPGGNGIVDVNDARTRVQKWYRRTYAQANLAPRLVVPVDAVDPPRNLLVVSNNSGANAAGNANNRMRFYIRGSAAGITYTVQRGDTLTRIAADHDVADWRTLYNHPQNAEFRRRRPDPNVIHPGDEIFIPASGGRVAVVYRPPGGATPIATAQELARRVRTAGYQAEAFLNAPRPGDPRGSADLLIREAGGGLVTLEDEESADNAQGLTVARVNTARFLVSSHNVAGGFSSHNIGTPEQRALARNYRTQTDRVECFVVGQVHYDDNSNQIRGRAVPPEIFRPAAEQPQDPFVRTTYMANITMNACNNTAAGDASDQNPFTFPHESGHVIIDAYHAQENHQLMRSGTSGTNQVAGSKRIYDSPVAFGGMAGVSPFNQVDRLRTSGAPVLEDWPAA